MPPSYIIDPAVDFHDGIKQWFQHTQEYTGLDNMYLFDEYQDPCRNGICVPDPGLSEFRTASAEDMVEYTDYPITADIPGHRFQNPISVNLLCFPGQRSITF